jgi:NAD(P)-dependent dehydrogenase (short-subunit alcohol dehydrogenase family)
MSKRIALITGAGTGVGRASAVHLASAGWTLVLSGQRQAPLEETASIIDNDETLIVSVDVRDPDSVNNLFAKTSETYGRLDLLFNNAGRGAFGLLEDLPLEDWQAVVDTNLTGAFLCTQHAFKLMKAQDPKGGRIINNGSISAHVPRPNSAPYTATKHAMTGLTKSTSLDGRKYNIACGQIDIGNAATPMTARMADGVPQADGTMKPEPTMDVGNVAKAVVYMADMNLDANVQFMTVMATQMPFVGRG